MLKERTREREKGKIRSRWKLTNIPNMSIGRVPKSDTRRIIRRTHTTSSIKKLLTYPKVVWSESKKMLTCWATTTTTIKILQKMRRSIRDWTCNIPREDGANTTYQCDVEYWLLVRTFVSIQKNGFPFINSPNLLEYFPSLTSGSHDPRKSTTYCTSNFLFDEFDLPPRPFLSRRKKFLLVCPLWPTPI